MMESIFNLIIQDNNSGYDGTMYISNSTSPLSRLSEERYPLMLIRFIVKEIHHIHNYIHMIYIYIYIIATEMN